MKSPKPRTATFRSPEALIANVVAEVLKDRVECPHVMLGPVVWQENQGTRQWYFALASGDSAGFFSIQVSCGAAAELAEQCRASAFISFLMRKPIVVHDTDDELAMARLCEAIWPGEKTRKVRAGVEAERQQWGLADEVGR